MDASTLLSWLPPILAMLIAVSTFWFVTMRTRLRAGRRRQAYLRHEIERLAMEKRILELQLEAETRATNAP